MKFTVHLVADAEQDLLDIYQYVARNDAPMKANKLLERCRVSSSKTVNGLTPRQRKELLDMLGL